MKAFNTIGAFVDRVVWTIGLFAIIIYSQSGWPVGTQRVFIVLAAASLLAFVWVFFVQPFRAGLREGSPALNTAEKKVDADVALPGLFSKVMTPKEVLLKWAAAFNSRDAAGAASLYHEHATNLQVAIGTPVQGRQAIHDDLVSFFTVFPDSYTHVEQILEDGEWAMIEWSGGGTFKGAFAGHAPTGKSFTLRGCGFFQVIAGKIHLQRGYWDKATWFGQIGLPVD
jgi:steroid delta-isomerase-like uncharacterized protein